MKLFVSTMMLLGLLAACGQDPTSESNASNKNVSVAESEVRAEKAAVSETERLNQWFAERYEEELQQSPITMTRLGRKDKYGEIDDGSEAAEIELLQWRADTVADLKKTFHYAALSVEAKVSYDIWVYKYDSAKAMSAFRRHSYVFTQMGGAHTDLPNFMINFHRVDEEADMHAYIKRISGISRAIGQLLTRAQLGAKEGVRPPRFAYDGVIEQSRKLLGGQPFDKSSEHDAPLLADAKGKIAALLESEKITEEKSKALILAVRQALVETFKPAYSNLIAWMEVDSANTTDDAKGAGALPNGEAYYTAGLLNHTTLAMSANEIHQLGLREVARLRAEMETLKTHAEFKGSLQEFFQFIKSDKQFFYPNDDMGRQGYLDDSVAYLDYIKNKLPEYFGLLPKADLVIKRVEAFRERDGAAQHYYPGTPDGSRSGIYYAHLSDMNSMPKNEMEAIAYHEGNPGHHMQISIAQELSGVPEFRTQVFFTSYVEGWALYSELLAKEMGAYQSVYTNFGRLVTEMWRAIRLVVDTGIHSKSWSEQQAIKYFKDNSPIADGQIKSEVQRYFVLPGQATSYKIGMLKFLELRAKAKLALGEQFDIRGFHDVVLGGGSVPLPILEDIVDNWIKKAKAGSAS